MKNREKIAYIRYTDSAMFILAPYNTDFISELKKSTKTRKWSKENKEWVVDIEERETVLNIALQHFPVLEDNKPPKRSDTERDRSSANTTSSLCLDNTDKYNSSIPVQAWIDGACEPVNPGGTASYGLVVKQRNTILLRKAGVVGSGDKMSNNVAEYSGLIALLEWCKVNSIQGVVNVHSDSTLLINQMSGRWRTKKKSQKGLYFPYYEKAATLLAQLGKKQFVFKWIAREKNTEADELSKQVLPISTE